MSGDQALFAFVGNPITGYRIQNKMAGADKAIGGTITNNGHVAAVALATAPVFVLENNNGHLVLRNVANSLGYLNDIQGTLGYWVNSSASTDAGSTLTFTKEKVSTSIVDVVAKDVVGTADIYDLYGRRLSTLQKGINVVNGKKIFVK